MFRKNKKYKIGALLLALLFFSENCLYAGGYPGGNAAAFSETETLAVPVSIDTTSFKDFFSVYAKKLEIKNEIKKELQLRRRNKALSFDFRLPRKIWLEVQERYAGVLIDNTISPNAHEGFLNYGLGAIDQQGRIHVPRGKYIYQKAYSLMQKAYSLKGTERVGDFKKYVSFYLKIYSALKALEEGRFKGYKDIPKYTVIDYIKKQLSGASQYRKLLKFYQNQYGSFVDEQGAEDEDAILRSMLTCFVANRALGLSTIEIVDDDGDALLLDEFWPLAEYSMFESLWMLEARFEEIAEKVLGKDTELERNFYTAKSRQEKLAEQIAGKLRRVPTGLFWGEIGLKQVIEILDPEIIREMESADAFEEYQCNTLNEYLTEETRIIRRYLWQKNGDILDEAELKRAFAMLKEQFVVIRSFDVFFRAVFYLVESEKRDIILKTRLNFESGQNAFLRRTFRAAKRIDGLIIASGLNNVQLAEMIGVTPLQIARWRKGEQKIANKSFLALAEILRQRLSTPLSNSMLEYGYPLDEKMNELTTFGARLYALRVLAGISLEKLSQYLEKENLGVPGRHTASRSVIPQWEQNINTPSDKLIYYKLAKLFNRLLNTDALDVPTLMFGVSLKEVMRTESLRHELEEGKQRPGNFGLRLKMLRLSAGLSPEQLAQEYGWDFSTIYRWENRNMIPLNKRSVKKLANFFNILKRKNHLFQHLKKQIEVTDILYGQSLETLLSKTEKFGERLKLMRMSLGYSAAEMSVRLKKHGLDADKKTIYLWEQYKNLPLNIKDQFMAYLSLYKEDTGRELDGTLLFYGKTLDMLLENIDETNSFRIIKYFRLSAGMDKQELAIQLKVAKGTVGNWERGDNEVSKKNKKKLVELFKKIFSKRSQHIKESIDKLNFLRKKEKNKNSEALGGISADHYDPQPTWNMQKIVMQLAWRCTRSPQGLDLLLRKQQNQLINQAI